MHVCMVCAYEYSEFNWWHLLFTVYYKNFSYAACEWSEMRVQSQRFILFCSAHCLSFSEPLSELLLIIIDCVEITDFMSVLIHSLPVFHWGLLVYTRFICSSVCLSFSPKSGSCDNLIKTGRVVIKTGK